MNSNFENNQIDTLVMISNARGSHLFAKYGRDESPVFKIKAIHNEYGKQKIQLAVMEVVYPKALYQELNSRAAVLKAIHDGMVVVKETQTTITFIPEMGQRGMSVDLPEVDCGCCELIVKSPVYVGGDCCHPITGCVEVDGNCPARNWFFVSKEPSQGLLDLNQETGEWSYQTTVNGLERDTFEVVVWNVAGAWAMQRTIVTCQPQPEVMKVDIINDKLTVQVEEPLDVNVATIPPVVVRTESEALAVDVVGMATVTIEGAVEVTGVDIEIPEVMTVTTAEDAPLAVAVQGVPVVTVEGAVEVTGVDIEIPEVMTVTTAEDAPLAVAVQGVPTVTIDGPIQLNPYTVYSASKTLSDIASPNSQQALFDTSKAIDQTIFIKIPSGVTMMIQPLVAPTGSTDVYALGDPIEKTSNFAFINTSPASKVGVEVSNPSTTPADVVVTIESHEPISQG